MNARKTFPRLAFAAFAAFLAVSCNPINTDPLEPDVPEDKVSFTIVVDTPQNVVVYPSDKGESVAFPFRIISEQPLKSLSLEITPGKGLTETHSVASDNMSGEILIGGTDSFTDESAEIGILAICGDVESSAKVSVVRAFLEMESRISSFPQEGGSKEFLFRTNVPCSVTLDEPSRSFASVSVDDGKAVLVLSANDGYSSRGGTVTIADQKGILPSLTISFSQTGSSGSRQTDSLALVKFYNEMGMDKWKEQGSFDVLYANWCTTAPLEQWCGVSTDSDVDPVTFENLHDGRVKRLNLLLVMADGSANTRPVPECIGDLRVLEQIEFTGGFVGELPRSLGTLQKLNRIKIYGGADMTGDLTDHPLKDVASQIKFWDVKGDLYGTVPVWFSLFKDFRLDDTHYSGRIPDEVVASEGMQKDNIWYETIGGVDLWTLKEIDATIIKNCSLNSYALWYGEKTPEGVEFVEDSHSGHWQWKSLDACIAWVKANSR